MSAETGPVLAADGTPLKASLNRALRAEKIRALMLISPLLIFILLTFIAPIADMLFRSVENGIVADTIPRTAKALGRWDPEKDELPGEDVFEAFYTDMVFASDRKTHTRLGTRLNYEESGISSLFRKSGRGVEKMEVDPIREAIVAAAPEWEEPGTWSRLFNDGDAGDLLPKTGSAYAEWRDVIVADGKDPEKRDPWNVLFVALESDFRAGDPAAFQAADAAIAKAAAVAGSIEPFSFKAGFEDIDDDWMNPRVWRVIRTYSGPYTAGYFLNSVDLQLTPDGIQPRAETEQIYIMLFKRTMFMSLVITFSCILLGYPIAFLLANLPLRSANVLMILVLLPFWTSLLVRTSAWKILLQQEGVINDILVWIGIVSDSNRLVMINNQLGTIIAMTHILLPFMILPLYSVMKTIPPAYVRAAKSLGATDWTAFWRVYFPNSVPGIGAGSILVFILAIGYYITPELVGGTSGVFISNRIAYHISSSLNWGLAAALGSILLAAVLLLYWVYDRIVGIDNVKLGG